MTTIAYKDGVLAGDSGIFDVDSNWGGSTVKVARLKNGYLWGAAGEAETRVLVELIENYGEDVTVEDLLATGLEAEGLLVSPEGKVWYVGVNRPAEGMDSGSAEVVHYEAPAYAIGHGAAYALGAMSAGASAVDAVKVASIWSALTREPIHTVSINDVR